MMRKIVTRRVTRTSLSLKMIEAADQRQLPGDHELRILATQFDEASYDYFRDPPRITVQKFMGAWARARKAYCALTGEPLV